MTQPGDESLMLPGELFVVRADREIHVDGGRDGVPFRVQPVDPLDFLEAVVREQRFVIGLQALLGPVSPEGSGDSGDGGEDASVGFEGGIGSVV